MRCVYCGCMDCDCPSPEGEAIFKKLLKVDRQEMDPLLGLRTWYKLSDEGHCEDMKSKGVKDYD